MRTALLAAALFVAAGAAAFFVLEDHSHPGPDDAHEQDGGPLPEAPVAHPAAEPDATRTHEPPAAPTAPLERVGVLEPDETLPEVAGSVVREAERRMQTLRVQVASREVSGTELLRAASEAFYVRARDPRDLKTLEQLRMSARDLGGRDVLRFGDLLDFWMREGFHVHPEGAFLVFEDERREDRLREVPPEPDPPPR